MRTTTYKTLNKGETHMEEEEEEALPFEIMLHIFSRLPVKPLLRLRCLSKSWRNIVLDPFFVNMQINRPIQEKPNLKLLLKCNNELYLLDYQSSHHRASKINHPIFNNTTSLWDACNGLMYTVSLDSVNFWNPGTGEHKPLPGFAMPYAGYGFGYNRRTDDYEFVRIVTDNVNHHSEVYIYSLRKNSCRRIWNIPYMIRDGTCGMFCNGSLYWVASDVNRPDRYNILIAYDVGGMTFRFVCRIEDDKLEEMNVRDLGGKLCLICYYAKRIEAWMCDQARNGWENLFKLERPNCLLDLKPLCINTHGCVLLLKNGVKLMCYNPETNKARPHEFYIEGISEVNEARTYTESIVGLGQMRF